MKILVYDVPAVSGGALTILESYYKKFLADGTNEYVFIIGRPILNSQNNVRVLSFPWVKKSKFHRLFFDYIYCRKINKLESPNQVFSLQNLMIPGVKVHQTVYVHQVIPFSDVKFNLFKDFNLWLYKNFYRILLFQSISKADQVIVQSDWLMGSIIEKKLTIKSKIKVEKPELESFIKKNPAMLDNSKFNFIYPASPEVYKNHEVIIKAIGILKSKDIDNFKVRFTLKGNETRRISKIFNEVLSKNLPVEFIGYLSKEKLYDNYLDSILIFPSKIESLGLPILEAKILNRTILAIDAKYSRELLQGYNNYFLFNGSSAYELSQLIEKIVKGNL